MQAYKIETRTIDGQEFTIEYHYDEYHGAPWEECDGHGVVSEWTRRAKKPGELVLREDRGSYRYYDVQATTKIAKRDCWGSPGHQNNGATNAQITAEAVRRDFEYLRDWCNDKWHYMGIVVRVDDADIEQSLWGIESNSDSSYIEEVIKDLICECQHDINRNIYAGSTVGV